MCRVSDIVFDQLKEMIVTQEWAPGDKIPSENEIAQMMSVSRVSVRSALQRLASIGIIESRQGEGTFVREYSTSRQLEHLKNFVKYKKSTTDGKDNIEIDVAFHLLIAKATQNPFIIEIFSILKDYLIMGIRKYQSFAGVESGVHYHEAILHSIKEKDPDKAYHIMEEHLKETLSV